METISNIFNTSVQRPLKALDVVSIADLTQHTVIMTDGIYDADDTIRQEWRHEVDVEHDMNYLTNKSFRIRFIDGSYLTVLSKELV